jgi:hypothetical protein
MRKWGNIIDIFSLKISGKDQNDIIQDARNLTELLEKASYYWTTEWQNEPVWIERRGSNETETSYSLIHGYKWENDDNPFNPPFYTPSKPLAMDGIDLAIEHGFWLANAPGESDCLEISNLSYGSLSESDVYSTQTEDDCTVWTPNNFQSTGALYVCQPLGSALFSFAIRFRNVPVESGETIVSARIQLHASFTSTTESPQTKIYAEKDNAPALITSYSDYFSRPLTTESVTWNIPSTIAGESYNTPDISSVIQEVVDLPGWSSGDDINILFHGVEPPRGGGRIFWDYDNADKPKLTLTYSDEKGSEKTCSDQIYVTNKDVTANLTDVYSYDVSTTTFSANLLDAALPHDIFPSAAAANDLCYFGSTHGPFTSLVFDIDSAFSTNTNTWEYYNGAWVSIPAADIETDSDSGYIDFETDGVGVIIFEPQSDWTTVSINGVTAYWVRAKRSSAIENPEQQNRSIYTCINSFVNISEDDVGGDIPAIGKIAIASTDTDRGIASKILVGLRSDSRGSSFMQHINMNGDNNTNISTTLYDVASNVSNIDAPSGNAVRTTWAADQAMTKEIRITIDSLLSQEYYGRYRAFVRGIDNSSSISEGDIMSYLSISLGSSYNTSYATNIDIGDDWHYFDYGIAVIPPTILPYIYYGDIYIDLYASNDAGAISFDWIDLVLFPIDEYSAEIRLNEDAVSNIYDITTIDSLSYLGKAYNFSVLKDLLTDNIKDTPIVISPSSVLFQAGADQKMFFFVPEDSKHEWVGKVQMWKNERYLTFRGDD